MPDSAPLVPRLTYLRIKNYRALRDVEFRDLTPLTVLIGPNGSGKSTVLDALDFLAEVVRGNLVGAWEKRDRFRGMRTRGEDGAIEFELIVTRGIERLRYILKIAEHKERVYVLSEMLYYARYQLENLIFSAILDKGFKFTEIEVHLINGLARTEYTESNTTFGHIASSESMLVFILFGSGGDSNYIISGYQDFLNSYRLLHLTDDHLKGYSDTGPREKLSPNGDNLPNVLYYLHDKHPEVLEKITAQLRRWIPQLADVVPEITSDERLLLRFKDAAFEKPLPAQYMSGGTMRLAALLTLLYEPSAAGLLGIEEPENELHPHLLPYLAEELIAASEQRQLLVATHAPGLLNALEPEQVWILHRGPDGYTQATRTADLPGIPAMVEEGSPLGYLWARNFFDVGSPLTSPQAAK